MAQLDVESPSELAEKMRWKRGFERTVARWIAGRNRPSFAYVMEMIDKAGWAGTAAEARPLNEAEVEAIAARREEIASLLKRLLELVGE